jgi:tetratricopeptide (TPR) repeat protein
VKKSVTPSTATEASGGISVVPPEGSGSGADEEAGGISVVPPSGAGGISVVPPNETAAKAQTSNVLAKNFLISLSPLREGVTGRTATAAPKRAHHTPTPPDPYNRFWSLHSQGRHLEALAHADACLAKTPADDAHGHLRWAYARTVAQRSIGDFDGALVTHNLVRPLVARISDLDLAGKVTHGRAVTLRELRRFEEAFDGFNAARSLFVKTGNLYSLASTDNNQALLVIAADRPREAHMFAARARDVWERLGLFNLCAEADDTRARAFLAQGRLREARAYANASVEALEGTREVRALKVSLATLKAVVEAMERSLSEVNQ